AEELSAKEGRCPAAASAWPRCTPCWKLPSFELGGVVAGLLATGVSPPGTALGTSPPLQVSAWRRIAWRGVPGNGAASGTAGSALCAEGRPKTSLPPWDSPPWPPPL